MTTYALWTHSIPHGFLTDSNIMVVQDSITAEIARFYNAYVVRIPKQDVVRIMIHAMEKRRESVPKMNRASVINASRAFFASTLVKLAPEAISSINSDLFIIK